jgi:uncharacterized membrane protein YagU involved in acid resistance
MRVDRRPSVWRGLFAGALGGLVGSIAMGQFHSLVLPKIEAPSAEKEDATVKTASAISQSVFNHELSPAQKKIAGPVVHFAFGTGVAAIYGALVEFAPPVRAVWGMPFGAAVWLGAHVITVPALGLSDPITASEPATEAAEFSAHVAYGAVVEGVRQGIRAWLIRC